MPNYGDVALGLKADWSRNQYENPEQVLFTVGHENGEPDLCLTDAPNEEHQFRWVDPLDKTAVTALHMKGYTFVDKATWTKRLDYLWEWNAEGKCAFGGQVAMARPKSRWAEDEAKRGRALSGARSALEREANQLPAGLVSTDPRPTTRRRQGI